MTITTEQRMLAAKRTGRLSSRTGKFLLLLCCVLECVCVCVGVGVCVCVGVFVCVCVGVYWSVCVCVSVTVCVCVFVVCHWG